jgi:hypothetical protein
VFGAGRSSERERCREREKERERATDIERDRDKEREGERGRLCYNVWREVTAGVIKSPVGVKGRYCLG